MLTQKCFSMKIQLHIVKTNPENSDSVYYIFNKTVIRYPFQPYQVKIIRQAFRIRKKCKLMCSI